MRKLPAKLSSQAALTAVEFPFFLGRNGKI
jgi:hypothetical protein